MPSEPRESAARVESTFHDTIWNAANSYGRVERCICDARDICYVIIGGGHVDSGLLEDLANRWLDAFGRDSWKERSS